jgi:hypothetical protein
MREGKDERPSDYYPVSVENREGCLFLICDSSFNPTYSDPKTSIRHEAHSGLQIQLHYEPTLGPHCYPFLTCLSLPVTRSVFVDY